MKPICICHKNILNEFLRWKMAIKSKGIPRAYDKNIVQDLINVTNAKRIYIQQAITVIQTNPLQPHALQNMKMQRYAMEWFQHIPNLALLKRPQIYRYLLTKLGSVKTR